jgi:hypothetical protein
MNTLTQTERCCSISTVRSCQTSKGHPSATRLPFSMRYKRPSAPVAIMKELIELTTRKRTPVLSICMIIAS